jgi:hypothetical protein
VSVVLTSPRLAPIEPNSPIVRRIDRAERRRLARHDRDSARSAELHGIRALAQRAVALVSSGWVQHSWFAITNERGQTRMVSARDVWDVTSQPVSGACLVGAIVHAGGGPSVVHSQIVQRSLDLTWHTLYGDSRQPVRWCPPPAVRMANVRDLTAWNDHPTRTASDVEALLQSTARATAVQAELCRAR